MNEEADSKGKTRMAIVSHAVPFLIWIVLMSLPMGNSGVRYALQSIFCLAALIVCKPWRYYPPFNLRLFLLSAAVGVGVFVLWVLPESSWARQWGGFYDVYSRFFVRQGGGGSGSMFAPEQCGWMYSSIRLAGSAFVIAVAEEFFWRGLLMRWIDKPIFWAVDPKKMGKLAFWITAMAFGAEHKQWLVGVLAGLAYGLLYVRKGDIWAAVTAHVITNYLLGLYVLATGAYYFW